MNKTLKFLALLVLVFTLTKCNVNPVESKTTNDIAGSILVDQDSPLDVQPLISVRTLKTTSEGGCQLVFSDEFKYKTINAFKWNVSL